MSYNKKNILEPSLLPVGSRSIAVYPARVHNKTNSSGNPLEQSQQIVDSIVTGDIIVSIVPTNSFQVIRNCATCNRKTRFQNSKRFRVNANGNKIDVWLIYSCEHCKHTLNLSIYERKGPHQIASIEYQKFLQNDETLAEEYGRSKHFFSKNRAEIDWETLSYCYFPESDQLPEIVPTSFVGRIYIRNDYDLNLRTDKVASEILQISRSQLKKLIKDQKIVLTKQHSDMIIDFK